jgi:hypothetical protein
MRFVVICKDRNGHDMAVGVYRSFKRAEGDARAWEGYVLAVDPAGCGDLN